MEDIVHRLKQAQRPIDGFIHDRLTSKARSELIDDTGQVLKSSALRQALIETFNQIVNGPSIYEEGRFEKPKLNLETQVLLERVGSDGNPVLLNRLLLEDSYRSKTSRNIVPYETRRFKLGFEAMFGELPRVQAAQAYEAVYLLAQAVRHSKSKMPVKIGAMFTSVDNWDGLEGEGVYKFRLDGSIQGKHVAIHELNSSFFQQPEFPDPMPEIIFRNLFENLDADQEAR